MNENSGMTFFSEQGALQAAIATLQDRELDLKAENEKLRNVLGYISRLPIVLDDKANHMTLTNAVDTARRATL